MPNALDPNLMTAAERLTEIGEILAAGILRLRASWLSHLSGLYAHWIAMVGVCMKWLLLD